MGTINNEVMVLVGGHLDKVADKARELLGDQKDLVLGPVKAINAVETLVIATSGSKVGWGPAERRAEACAALLSWLGGQRDCWASWARVTFWEESGDVTTESSGNDE